MNAKIVKFLFIFMALGLTILLFSWPAEEEHLNLSTRMEVIEAPDDLSQTSIDGLASTIMEEPNFTGEDLKNNRWSVKAARAIQTSSGNYDIVKLEKVEASSTSASGRKLLFVADEGVFSSDKFEISLSTNVKIKGYGYTLETENISGNIKTRDIASDAKVEIKGLKGNLIAGKFSMSGKNNKLLLTNGVKMRLYLNRTEKSYAEGKKQ